MCDALTTREPFQEVEADEDTTEVHRQQPETAPSAATRRTYQSWRSPLTLPASHQIVGDQRPGGAAAHQPVRRDRDVAALALLEVI